MSSNCETKLVRRAPLLMIQKHISGESMWDRTDFGKVAVRN